MSTGFYNILTFIDNICEAYEEKKENDRKNNDNNDNNDSKEESINNIRTIRNILNVRNINEDYNNNRHIISNILRRNNDRNDNNNDSNNNRNDNTLSSIISLFVTNYMNNRDNIDNKNVDDGDIDLSVCVYTDLDEVVKEKNENCSICFEKNDCDDTLILTKCDHVYHYKCLKEWVDLNKTCPLCRSVI